MIDAIVDYVHDRAKRGQLVGVDNIPKDEQERLCSQIVVSDVLEKLAAPSDAMLEAGCAAMGPNHGNVVVAREVWLAMLAAVRS